MRDLAKLGKVLDTLVEQGANQVNGPSFEVDKPDEAYDEARVGALKKAQARAKDLCRCTGLEGPPHRQHQRRWVQHAAADADDAR